MTSAVDAHHEAHDATAAPTAEQVRQIEQAKKQRRKIDSACVVAGFNGWTAGVLAALSAPFVLLSHGAGVAALVLGAVAYVEFRGRRMLREMDLRGPKVLACNQVVLGVIVILYALWMLIAALTGEGQYAQAIAQEPALASTLAPIGDLMRFVEIATYSLLIIGTVAFQGGMAWYYLSRGKHMRNFLDNTPPWVIDVLRAAA